MDVNELLEAGRVLRCVSDELAGNESDPKKAIQMSAALLIADSFITEIAAHLSNGAEPHGAVVSALEGSLLIGSDK